jgi:DNA-binding CsgD family transcriptional regulator
VVDQRAFHIFLGIIGPAGDLPSAARERARFTLGDHTFVVVEESVEPLRCVDNHTIDLTERLTGRELQIAMLVALGHPTKRIAFKLCISEWTVSAHLRRIFLKLGVDSRAAMVYCCAPLIQRLDREGLPQARRAASSSDGKKKH